MVSQSSTADLIIADDSSVVASLEALSSQADHSTPYSTTTTSSKKKDKPRTGWYFNHMPDEDPETKYYNAKGYEEWRCKYCPSGKYQLSGGNWCIKKHLLRHEKREDSPRTDRSKRQQASIQEAMAFGDANPQKRRRLDNGAGDSINGDHLEVLYVKFITACNQSLRLVECPEFRDFLVYLNKDVETWLPYSHNTVKEWVLRQFKDQKERIKQRIHSARSVIHISCDLWTSPNDLAILGVIAHYIAEDGKLESSVLAMKDIVGNHDGVNLAGYIMEVISDWGFAAKLGYFQMDNARNNDTMLRKISFGTYLLIYDFNILWKLTLSGYSRPP